ncbi:MAG: DUF2461 domain-containing protein [Cytophagaceae bacterium]
MYKELFSFLKGLKKNNHKEWFDKNRDQYQELRTEFVGLVDQVIKYVSSIDPEIGYIEAKHCIFRINRDIRFSKDKTPYKTHFSAFISEKGRKSFGPGYYIHLEPGGNSLIAGGVYLPDPEALYKIRQEIDYNGNELKAIIKKPSFKNLFPFIDGEKLSRAPKGFSEDSEYIDLIKLKSFSIYTGISDEDVLKGNMEKFYKKGFKEMVVYNDFFRKALE